MVNQVKHIFFLKTIVRLVFAFLAITATAYAEVLFTENFESQDWESRWETPSWAVDGVVDWVTNHPNVLEGNRSIRVTLNMSGAVTQNRVFRHFLSDTTHTRLFMRWYQLVEGGHFFQANSRLELKGNALYGWIPGNAWPQNLDPNNPKFTHRASMKSFPGLFMYGYFGGLGNVGVIGYHDQPATVKPNVWQCVEIELAGNTIGQSDGALRMWVDNVNTGVKTGLSLREDSRMRILAIEDNFRLHRYLDDGLSNATAVVWRDAVVVATERIGCDLGTAPPPPPPPPPGPAPLLTEEWNTFAESTNTVTGDNIWNKHGGCYDYSLQQVNDPCNATNKVLAVLNIMGEDNGNCTNNWRTPATGNCVPSGSTNCTAWKHRVEVIPQDANIRADYNVHFWAGWRVLVSDWPTTTNRIEPIITQEIPSQNDGVDWDLRLGTTTQWEIIQRTSPEGAPRVQQTFTLTPPVIKGEWYNFVLHYHRTTATTGRAEMWINGIKKYDHTGPTSQNQTNPGLWKFGVYLGAPVGSSRWGQQYRLLYDEIRVAKGLDMRAVVEPRRTAGCQAGEPPPPPPPPPGEGEPPEPPEQDFGVLLETCTTEQQAGTNGLVIVPDDNASLENAVETNTNKTILVREGAYNVGNFAINTGNVVLPYDCGLVGVNVNTTTDNTITADNWTIGGLYFNCGGLNRDCLRTCNADGWTLRNNHFAEVLRGAPNIACDSSNGTITGNIFESCSTCTQGEMSTIGDVADPGGVGCGGIPCRYGPSPSNITATRNHFRGYRNQNNGGGGPSLLTLTGLSRLGVVVQDNKFSMPHNFHSFVNFYANWERPGNVLNGSVDLSHNTFIGPFSGANETSGPASPCVYLEDWAALNGTTNCKASGDCPAHQIHHNFMQNCYGVLAGTDGTRQSGGVKGHSNRYHSAFVGYNVDHGGDNTSVRYTETVDNAIYKHNTYFNTGAFGLKNEVCTDTHATLANLVVDNNVFAQSRILDECAGTPDWDITNNIFTAVTGTGFLAGHLDSGNETVGVSFGSVANKDYTVIQAAQSQKGATPAPVITSAAINPDCVLNVVLNPYTGDGYEHGPIKILDPAKLTVKYGAATKTVTGSSISGDTARFNINECPLTTDTVTFSATYGWCRDSANVGGTEAVIDGRCVAVTNQAVTNNIAGGGGGDGTVFYVDVTCGTNGNGTTATCGANGPWNTIKNALQVADCSGMTAGDILEIKGDAVKDLTCEGAGTNCYFEDNVNIEGACRDIIIQNAENEHVVVNGTMDISGSTWTSIGNGVFRCATSGCSGDVGDKFAFAAWYDRGAGEELLTLEQTNQTCDTTLAAGKMRITQADQSICVKLSNSTSPAAAAYFRVPWFDPFLQASADTASGITLRANPVGTGSFTVERYRSTGIQLNAFDNPGWTIDGLTWTEMMDRCIDYSHNGPDGDGGLQVLNNTISFCGQEGLRVAGELGNYAFINNTITDTQTEPMFQFCQGVGTGCLAGFSDNGTGIRMVNRRTGAGGIIRGNTILRGGGGKQGRFRGINLENDTANNIVEDNYIAHARGLPLEGTAIHFSSGFATDLHVNNVVRNNRIWDVDIGVWFQFGTNSTSQAGTTNYIIGNTFALLGQFGIRGSWSGNGALDGTVIVQNNILDGDVDTGVLLLDIPSTRSTGWTTVQNNAFECDGCAAHQDIISFKGIGFERTEDCTTGTDCIADMATRLGGTGFTGNVYGNIGLTKTGSEPSLVFTIPSVALNAGRTVALLTDDYAGTARPQGATHDIGAYELPGSGPSGTLEQRSYRIYDRGAPEGSQPLAGENTAIGISDRGFFTLRIGVVSNDGVSLSQSLQLWARLCSPSCGSFALVDASPSAASGVYIVDHPSRTNRTETTNQLSLGGLTFSAGGLFIDADTLPMVLSIEQDRLAELEYSLGITTAVDPGDTIELRIEESDGTDLTAYTATPLVMLKRGGGNWHGGMRR